MTLPTVLSLRRPLLQWVLLLIAVVLSPSPRCVVGSMEKDEQSEPPLTSSSSSSSAAADAGALRCKPIETSQTSAGPRVKAPVECTFVIHDDDDVEETMEYCYETDESGSSRRCVRAKIDVTDVVSTTNVDEEEDPRSSASTCVKDDNDGSSGGGSQSCVDASSRGGDREEAGGENDLATAKRTDAGSKEAVTSTSPPIARSNDDVPPGSIRIGSVTYESPFRQYGEDLADHLNALLRSRREGEEEIDALLSRADRYVGIGLAHREELIVAVEPANDYDDGEDDDDRDVEELLDLFRRSQNAFETAIDTIRNEVRPRLMFPGDVDGALSLEGEIELHLAELFHHYHPDGPRYEKALRHYRRAEDVQTEVFERFGNDDGGRVYRDRESSIIVELNMASSAVRVGSILIEIYDSGMTVNTDGTLISSVVEELIDEDPSQQQQQHQHDNHDSIVVQALDRFELGVKTFRRSSKRRFNVDANEDRMHLADALHNAGVANLYLRHVPDAIEAWEESLSIYLAAVEDSPATTIRDYYSDASGMAGGYDDEAAIGAIVAETLHSLSDAYLQSGKYNEAVKKYKESMEWYSKLGVHDGPRDGRTSPAPASSMSESAWAVDGSGGGIPDVRGGGYVAAFDSDENLAMHHDALERYYEFLRTNPEGEVPHDYGDEPEYYYEPDEVYEASMHAAIGSIYLSRNEPETAMGHLHKAVRLYKRSLGENDLSLADTILNVAYVHLRLGEYDDSVRAFEKATQIYRSAVGDGIDPFSVERDEGYDAMDGRDISAQPSGTGNNGAEERAQRSSGADARGNSASDGGGGVHDRLIDLGEYQSGLLNNTL